MTRVRKLFCVSVAAVGFAAALVPSAALAAAAPLKLTVLTGQAGKVVVGESQGKGSLSYYVDVLGSTQVNALAISNGGSFPGPPEPAIGISGWNGRVLDSTQWNNGTIFTIGQTTTVNTSSLGSYSSLFGTDPRVTFYYRELSGAVALTDGNDADQPWTTSSFSSFGVSAALASEFIALDGSGQLIESSLSSVPEPASLGLLGAAVGMLLRRRSRKA